jgi:hypothetical protein
VIARGAVAGVLALAASPALADRAVPGAPDWMLIESVANDCYAETGAGQNFANGDTLHIKLMKNGRGNLVLAGARPEWRNAGTIEFSLTIDNGPPETLRGSNAISLVLTEIRDPALIRRLRDATMLTWQLPWGNFTARVSGLGVAYDAVAECKRRIEEIE